MINHSQQYIRHSTASIDDVLPKILDVIAKIDARKKIDKILVNGVEVNAKSLRLRTFALKGLVCACCGRKATHFALERTFGADSYHLNLWATDPDGDEYLMTHDHILARSLGGLDRIENTQTMCSPCNAEKGKLEQELARKQNEA